MRSPGRHLSGAGQASAERFLDVLGMKGIRFRYNDDVHCADDGRDVNAPPASHVDQVASPAVTGSPRGNVLFQVKSRYWTSFEKMSPEAGGSARERAVFSAPPLAAVQRHLGSFFKGKELSFEHGLLTELRHRRGVLIEDFFGDGLHPDSSLARGGC